MLGTKRQDNPFVGLRSFNSAENHLFFGREGQTDELLRRLQHTQFLAVVGTSGSGKSSLVRAGLLPALDNGFMVGASSVWKVATLRPGNAPIANLARELHHKDVFGIDPECADIQQLVTETTLRLSSLGLIEVVQRESRSSEANLLIVVDQFEELFRFKQQAQIDKARTDEASNEAAAFVKLLLEATENREVSVYVVLTMRSDFFGECAQFRNLPEAINDSLYLIPRLTRDELRSAIVGPISVGSGKIRPRLVNKLLNDVGDNPDQLPVLQHALLRTWNQWKKNPGDEYIDLPHYLDPEIGGMQKALSIHADKVYNSLDAREKEIAEVLFKQLTEKGTDDRGFRRPTPLGAVCAVAEATLEEVIAVVEQFRQSGRSFLMPPESEPLKTDTVLDISHESLMRIWNRLKKWVDEEAENAATYCRLAETAALHEAGRVGLLQEVELEVDLEWLKKVKPRSAWAERYDPNYDRAIKFFGKSLRRSRKTKKALERLQREQLEQEAQQEREAREREEEKNQTLRRLLIAVVLGSLSSVIAVVLGSIAFFNYQEAEHRKLEAEKGQLAALKASSDAYFASNRQLESLLASLKAGRRLQELRTQGTSLDQDTQLRTLGVLQQRVYEVRERNRLQGHTKEVYSLSFSPDGQQIATASSDRTVRLWGRDGKPLGTLPHQEPVTAVDFSPDGKTLASASTNGTVQLWRLDNQKPVLTLQQSGVNRLSFSPDGTILTTASQDKTVKLWRVRDGKPLTTPLLHNDAANSARFSRDGKVIVTTSKDRIVRLWNRDGRLLKTFKGHREEVEEASLSPDGQLIVSASHDKTVRLWNRDGTPLKTLSNQNAIAHSVDFSPDGQVFAATGADGTVRLWSKKGEPLQTFKGHNGAVRSVRFSPDRKTLASAGDNGSVILWSRDIQQSLVTVLKGHDLEVTSVSLSPDGRTLVSGSIDNTIRLWNRDGKPLKTLREHTDRITRIRFSPDGQTFASASWDGFIKLWSANGTLLNTFPKQPDGINSISFSPDSQTLASAGLDGSIQLWTGARMPKLLGRKGGSSALDVSFGPGGKTIASIDDDGRTANLRSLNGASLISFSPSDTGDYLRVAFGSDERLIAAAVGKIIALRSWNGNSVEPLRELVGHSDNVTSLGFSADGKILFSASLDGTTRLWNPQTGETLSTLQGHRAAVRDISFDSAHQVIASASDDQTIILWQVGLNDLLTLGCREVQDYLKNARNLPESDRQICAGQF